jgi:hypothetical protein
MAQVVPMPVETSVLIDARGSGRAMRVTWHHEAGDAGLVVLSLWHDEVCVGSFRLDAADVPALVQTLVEGLGASGAHTSRLSRTSRSAS